MSLTKWWDRYHLFPPFLRWRNRGTDWLNNCPDVILVRDGTNIQTWVLCLQACALISYTPVLPSVWTDDLYRSLPDSEGQACGPTGQRCCRWRGTPAMSLYRVHSWQDGTLGLIGNVMPITCKDETLMIFIVFWSRYLGSIQFISQCFCFFFNVKQ